MVQKKFDRRKHQRFKVKEGACAAHYNSKIRGQVVNISKGGLAFRYINNKNEPVDPSELILYISGNNSYFLKLSVKVVSDIEWKKEARVSNIQFRQRGVQFENLTEGQTSLLETFMNTYTVGPVNNLHSM